MRRSFPIAGVISILLLGFHCVSQTIPAEDALRPKRWDATQGVLFVGEGLHFRTSKPIRVYRAGAPPISIDIFSDFSDLQKNIVTDFAAGPNGATIIAAILNFGARALRHVILTYDSSGKLRTIWDTEPYFTKAIAADRDGNVFMLGYRLDEARDGNPYPLLVEYDPGGNVIREFLKSSLFETGSDAIEMSRDGIEPSLFVAGGTLLVYVPKTTEILVYSTTGGSPRSRIQLHDVLAQIARADDAKRVSIEHVAFVDDYSTVLDLIEYSNTDDVSTTHVVKTWAMRPVAYLMNLTTLQYTIVRRGVMGTWMFLGARDNRLQMMSLSGDMASVKSYELPR